MTGRLAVALGPGLPVGDRLLACEVIGARAHLTGTLDADSPAGFDVPEGTYVVRAALPSGAFMSSVAHVDAGGDVTVTLRHAGPAPDAGPPSGADDGGERGPGLTGRPVGGLDAVDGGHHHLLDEDDDLLETLGVEGEPQVLPTPEPPVPPRAPRRHLWARLWLGSLTAAWTDIVDVQPDGAVRTHLSTGPGPYAVQVGGPDVAWRVVRLPPSYGATLVVERSDDETGFDDAVHVGVEGTSPLASSMLRYLQTGQLDAAQVVAPELVQQAQRLFQDKMASPEGAAAAGYFLLRVGQQESIADWPANFAAWFGWLPDSSVIHAWQLLRRPGVPDRDLARLRLLQAADAGVPCYTEGLRLLLQGLQALAGESPDDAAVADALARVREYAAACDWEAVHTTYWAVRPDTPGLERHTGWPLDADGWVTLPTHPA